MMVVKEWKDLDGACWKRDPRVGNGFGLLVVFVIQANVSSAWSVERLVDNGFLFYLARENVRNVEFFI